MTLQCLDESFARNDVVKITAHRRAEACGVCIISPILIHNRSDLMIVFRRFCLCRKDFIGLRL